MRLWTTSFTGGLEAQATSAATRGKERGGGGNEELSLPRRPRPRSLRGSGSGGDGGRSKTQLSSSKSTLNSPNKRALLFNAIKLLLVVHETQAPCFFTLRCRPRADGSAITAVPLHLVPLFRSSPRHRTAPFEMGFSDHGLHKSPEMKEPSARGQADRY